MKFKGLIFFSFLLLSFYGFSQNSNHKSWVFKFDNNINDQITQDELNKISSAFGSEKFQDIISNQALKKYYLNILRNRVSIHEKKYYSQENLKKLSSVGPNFTTIEKFNPLLYDFPFFSKESHVYRIDGTDFLIVINPQKIK